MKLKTIFLLLTTAISATAQWNNNDKTPLPMAQGPATEFDVAFNSDDRGNSYYAWTDFRSGNGEIYVQKLNQFGESQFTSGGLRIGKIISGVSLQLAAKSLFISQNGDLVVVWHEIINSSQPNIKNIRITKVSNSGELMSSEGILVAQSILNSDINKAVLTVGEDSVTNLFLVYNAPGGSGDQLVLQKFDSDLQKGESVNLKLAFAEGSKVAFDKREGTLDVFVRQSGPEDFKGFKYDLSGQNLVGLKSVLNNSFSGESRIDDFQNIDGFTYLGRSLSGSGPKKVVAQKLDQNLNNIWKTGGVVLGTNNAYDIHIGPNENGGGIMAWNEPNLTETKMMAAGVDAQGNVLWQKPVFKTQAGKSYFTPHKFASDGEGGCYVMWFTSKAVGFDMSIQHLDANGNQLFGEFGLQLTDFKWWSNYRLVPHESGGVIALYSGSKNDDINVEEYDLYTNYISPEGEFGLEQKLVVQLNRNDYCAGEKLEVSSSDAISSVEIINEGGNMILTQNESGFNLPEAIEKGDYQLIFKNHEGLESEAINISIQELQKPVLTSSADFKCPETDEAITLSGTCDLGNLLWSTSETTSDILVSPASSTTYSASCQKTGCAESQEEQIEIEVATVNATASGGGTVNEGADIQLSATGGSTYQWTGPNGFSSSEQNPLVQNAAQANAGVYSVQVTNSRGCVGSAELTVEVQKVLSSLASEQYLAPYPNPTKDFLRVNIEKHFLRASAVALNGKSYDLPISADLIDLRGLSDGVYVLKLMDKSRVWHFFKVVKE
ncbi:hypothetical protein [Jiulongibacter sediminis]|uniref:Secretion system C-terminal sorting domain-containing protein n=1 Tax=Jiulongibacter sediminis TaxID=1605367 RepID=A0A0P7BZB2_9BACT|nr:hypothetical protein [Jiulongibacter sediminis]KPM49816.1 hypothetical protein AFM12_04375 [Jiulongibacter sediminis]TBX26853.1 hypothetical protein TK44_04380 [Jiulongibacter sediminis]